MDGKLAQVIEDIYEVAALNLDWDGVLNGLADVAGGDLAWLVLSMPRERMNAVIAPRSDPAIIADYQNHWWSKDVTVTATCATPVGEISSLQDTGRDRFAASEFYNDFWRRSGHASERLAAILALREGAFACIGLQPSRRDDCIDADMARVFAAIVPHAVRAVAIRMTLRKFALERELAQSTPRSGVILVDAGARAIVCDDTACQCISKPSGVTLDSGQVALPSRADTARLHRLVASCDRARAGTPRGGQLVAFDCALGESLTIDVVPYVSPDDKFGPEMVVLPRPVAMLILTDEVQQRHEFCEKVRARFGLTPAEAAVTFELLGADGRQATADRLGISLATVRTHMMRIFAKVGVSSQAALFVRLAGAGIEIAPLGSKLP